MARISGVDLPRDKRVEIGLTYIYGIGRVSSNKILEKANVNPDMTIQRLDEKYAEYGCIGYVGILWLDGRPVNDEAYVKVTVKS